MLLGDETGPNASVPWGANIKAVGTHVQPKPITAIIQLFRKRTCSRKVGGKSKTYYDFLVTTRWKKVAKMTYTIAKQKLRFNLSHLI
jgi:hypothetical protein